MAGAKSGRERVAAQNEAYGSAGDAVVQRLLGRCDISLEALEEAVDCLKVWIT